MNKSPIYSNLVALFSFLVVLLGMCPLPVQATPDTYVIPAGEARVYQFDNAIERVAIGNPDVADYIILNPSELYLLGKKTGETNLIIWDKEGEITSAPLQVIHNSDAIKSMLKSVLPHENDIRVYSWGPAMVLAGSVADALAEETAYRLVSAYLGGSVPRFNPEYTLIANSEVSSGGGSGITGIPNSAASTVQPASIPGMGTNTSSSGSVKGIVNLLTIRDPMQVRLEVRIAEVSRSCMQALGLSWTQGLGNIQGSLMTGFVSDASINALFNGANQLQLNNQCKKSLVKILAEPTIVAMSGKEGYFLVGGKVYTPSVSSNGAIDYVERTYGVGLRFTPTVLDAGRLSLKVAPEVSEPLQVAVTAGTSSSLPSFKLSYASTTVQMNEGENLVIGGLLRDNVQETIRTIPLLSDIPILGSLFRHTEKNTETTELMVIVRPTRVEASASVPELPTDRLVPPTHEELFFEGKLEGAGRTP